MKKCCESKLGAVLILIGIRDRHYEGLERQFERDTKKNKGNTEVLGQHLSVISYRKELKSIKEMINLIIKDGI